MKNINSLSGIEFENLCQVLLQKMGFSVQTTKQSNDGGIDLIAYSHQTMLSGKYIIQCKRYSGSVGVAFLRELFGVITDERANKGILITSGYFTRSAYAFAEDKNIELIDGKRLDVLLNEMNIKVDPSSSETFFTANPHFESDKYDYYKRLISDNACTKELGHEFLFRYFENEASCAEKECIDILHNGLADEFLHLFDWYTKKYYNRGKKAAKILPYYVRKYKGLAQLYNFDLFDYVQSRYTILSQKQTLKVWTNLFSEKGKYYEWENLPEEMATRIWLSLFKEDYDKVKYALSFQQYELLNLYSILKYFSINEGCSHIIRQLKTNIPTQFSHIWVAHMPHLHEFDKSVQILSPEINVYNGYMGFVGFIRSDKEVTVTTDYAKTVSLEQYFDRYAKEHKDKIEEDIKRIKVLFRVLNEK